MTLASFSAHKARCNPSAVRLRCEPRLALKLSKQLPVLGEGKGTLGLGAEGATGRERAISHF